MSRGAGRKGGKHREERVARNARNRAYMDLAEKAAAVFGAGVYTKDELQSAVCTYVSDMRNAGESGDDVVKASRGVLSRERVRPSASALLLVERGIGFSEKIGENRSLRP